MSAASKQDLISWFKEGVNQKKSHMIVFCDQIDWFDFPVYTSGLEEFKEEYLKYSEPHSAIVVVEVYDLNMSMDEQMKEYRAHHYPDGFNVLEVLSGKSS